MAKNRGLYIIIVYLTMALVFSCSEGKVSKNSQEIDDHSNTDLEWKGYEYAIAIYRDKCITCHPPDISKFVERTWKNGNSRDELHHSIEKGHIPMGVGQYTQSLPDSAFAKLTDYILEAIERKSQESVDEIHE